MRKAAVNHRKGVGGRPIRKRTRASYVRELYSLRCFSGALLLDSSLDQEKTARLIQHLTSSIMILQELINNIPLA